MLEARGAGREARERRAEQVQAAHLSLVESIAWSPDGKLIASGSYQEFALWEAQTGQLKQKVNGLSDNVVTLAFSKDSKTLATGGIDRRITLWNVADLLRQHALK